MLEWLLRRLRVKRIFADTVGLRERVVKSRPAHPAPPRAFYRRYRVEEAQLDGRRVFTLSRRDGDPSTQILYLHGGAYVYEMMGMQWTLLGKLLDGIDVAITVPLFPLAPEHTSDAVMRFVSSVYDRLVATGSGAPVVLLGDSSGAGMAVALSQQLRDAGGQPADRLVLLSPWLDVTCSDPAQNALEQLDPVLARAGLREEGQWYAGTRSTSDPRISPLFGVLTDLPRMLVLTGTHDLLYADATRLQQALAGQPAALELKVYPRMMHVWPAMPIPEAAQAIRDVTTFLAAA